MNFDHRDNAEFLSEEGQLKYELTCQMDHYREQGNLTQDVIIHFMNEGVVHHPELFEAVIKGYKIDTTDFVINTSHNYRSRDGIHNY